MPRSSVRFIIMLLRKASNLTLFFFFLQHAYVHVCVCACTWRPKDCLGYHPQEHSVSLLRQGLWLIWNSPTKLDWLAMPGTSVITHLQPPSTGGANGHHHAQCGCWGANPVLVFTPQALNQPSHHSRCKDIFIPGFFH